MSPEPVRRLVVVSRALPDPRGTAPGRLAYGFAVGARRLGHDVTVWSWWPGPAPAAELPSWVQWQPLPQERWLPMKARAALRPRSDVVAAGWRPPADTVAIAEEFHSFPVVRDHPMSVAVMHYSTRLDAAAVGWTAGRVQDLRAERRAARGATVTVAYSGRVAEVTPGRPRAVPCALEVPEQPLPAVDSPVAACVADWRWSPNRRALRLLLAAWPTVRAAVPGAQLLVAGYGDPGIGAVAGVRWLGAVADSTDVLAEAAVLAFPCPPSSGPKVKVLEAAALGLPVVTTPAGIEGLHLDGDAVEVVTKPAGSERYADRLIAVLRDPCRRAAMSAAARAAVQRSHAPEPAAAARLAAIEEALA